MLECGYRSVCEWGDGMGSVVPLLLCGLVLYIPTYTLMSLLLFTSHCMAVCLEGTAVDL